MTPPLSLPPLLDTCSLAHLVRITKDAFTDLVHDTLTYADLEQSLEDPSKASPSKVKEVGGLVVHLVIRKECEGTMT